MASLQELRKRLRSIRSIEQLAGAMRTAATAKYSRLSKIREEFKPYRSASAETLRLLGASGLKRTAETVRNRNCIIVLSGNRGLCGGFHTELLRFLERTLKMQFSPPLLLVSGRKAVAWLRERNIPFEEYPTLDIPEYAQIKAMAERAEHAYIQGEVRTVQVVFQRFRNMLTQESAMVQFLPETDLPVPLDLPVIDEDLLYLPDRETIEEETEETCLDAKLYELALENAAGVQAATIMSMRSACDNAQKAAAELEITINRRRQAEITSSVIETAAGSQGD